MTRDGGYGKPTRNDDLVLGIHHFKGSNAAGINGRLVLHHGCVSLKVGPDVPLEMLAWPSGFTVEATRHGFHIRDEQGEIVGASGHRVRMGGGPIDAGAISTTDGGSLPTKCVTSHMFAVGLGMAHEVAQPDGIQTGTSAWAPIDRTSSLKKAVSKLRSKLSVPVILPAKLPRGSHLDPRKGVRFFHLGGPLTGRLTFLFGSKKLVIIDYGLAVFDGCGGPGKAVYVGTQLGLVSNSSTPNWTQLIWPATAKHPEGRYGVTGSFSPRRALAIARSMTPSTRVAAEGGLVGC